MWFGLLGYISLPFEPIMGLLGLPKEMALVWASAMLTNNYTAVVLYINISPAVAPLNVAQATVLATVILIAHNLPVEGGVCRGAGVSPLRVTSLRILAAVLFGLLCDRLCLLLGWGLEEARFIAGFQADPVPPWGVWLLGNLKSLAAIFLIVWALILLMALMRKIGLLKLCTMALSPLMRLSGVGPKATMITLIGMLMGLAYGGGLIIAESKGGQIPREDVYGSIMLMAICHSLLEDTIVMSSLGGSLWGLLIGRIVFGVLLAGLIVRTARRPMAQTILVGKKYLA
jgi:spore maturation protein SpmB